MTDTRLSPSEYLGQLDADHRRIHQLVEINPVAPVPTCPGWSLHELVRHLAGGYDRVTRVIRTGQRQPGAGELVGDAGPTLQTAYTTLRDLLTHHDPDEPTWTWAPADADQTEHTVGFWHRRMVHETAVHRVDAELAVGDSTPVPHAVAVDGIAELMQLWIPQCEPPVSGSPFGAVAVRTGAHAWRVQLDDDALRVQPGPGHADTTLSGEPSELYLFLWGRRPASAVQVDGDPAAVAELRRRMVAVTQ